MNFVLSDEESTLATLLLFLKTLYIIHAFADHAISIPSKHLLPSRCLPAFRDGIDFLAVSMMYIDEQLKHDVRTCFTPDNTPNSNLLLGEVVTRLGKRSYYLLHHHPQPEVQAARKALEDHLCEARHY